MLHPKLLINFLSLSIAGQIDGHTLGRNSHDRLVLHWRQADLRAHPKQILLTCRVSTFSCRHMFWHAQWDPTIVMAAYNNNGILMVPYEDLPNEDKYVISKAIEEF